MSVWSYNYWNIVYVGLPVGDIQNVLTVQSNLEKLDT